MHGQGQPFVVALCLPRTVSPALLKLEEDKVIHSFLRSGLRGRAEGKNV